MTETIAFILNARSSRAFSMGKQLSPSQKNRLSVSTIASQLLIKTHCKLYRKIRERCHSSRRIPIEFDNPGSLYEIVEELNMEQEEDVNNDIDQRTLRHEIRNLKLWNVEPSPSRGFPSKLSSLIPEYVKQEPLLITEFTTEESSESADLLKNL